MIVLHGRVYTFFSILDFQSLFIILSCSHRNLGAVERLREIDPNSFINGDFVITL